MSDKTQKELTQEELEFINQNYKYKSKEEQEEYDKFMTKLKKSIYEDPKIQEKLQKVEKLKQQKKKQQEEYLLIKRFYAEALEETREVEWIDVPNPEPVKAIMHYTEDSITRKSNMKT